MASDWKGQTRGGLFGYRFFIWLIRRAGIRTAYAFLYLVVPYFVLFAPKAVKSVWAYSRKSLRLGRGASFRMIFKNFHSLGKILIDKMAINGGMSGKYTFEFENYNQFLNILDSGSGVIMIGAHTGNWEIGVPFFDKYGGKLNIVMYDNEHQRIKELLAANAIPHEYKVIPVNEDNLSHIFAITAVLRKGEYVCFQGDRYTPEEKTVRGRFLGRDALFPLGPFLLASKMRTPVVFYFAMREPGMKYRFYFYPMVPGSGKLSVETVLEKYAAVLEKMVKEYPEQWFNYYDFWKNDTETK